MPPFFFVCQITAPPPFHQNRNASYHASHVPSPANAKQLEEMWSSSTCQHASDSLSLKSHPWLVCSEKQTMEQCSGFRAVRTEGLISMQIMDTAMCQKKWCYLSFHDFEQRNTLHWTGRNTHNSFQLPSRIPLSLLKNQQSESHGKRL